MEREETPLTLAQCLNFIIGLGPNTLFGHLYRQVYRHVFHSPTRDTQMGYRYSTVLYSITVILFLIYLIF